MRCFYYQWLISRALDAAPAAPRLPTRHLAQCPACRRFLEQSRTMAAALRSAARRQLPATARAVVMAAPPAPRPRWCRPAFAAGVVAAAAAIVAALFLLTPAAPVPLATVSQTAPPPGHIAPPINPTPPMPAPFAVTTDPLALLDVEQSLATLKERATDSVVREFNKTSAEVKSAGQMLISCLPISPHVVKQD